MNSFCTHCNRKVLPKTNGRCPGCDFPIQIDPALSSDLKPDYHYESKALTALSPLIARGAIQYPIERHRIQAGVRAAREKMRWIAIVALFLALIKLPFKLKELGDVIKDWQTADAEMKNTYFWVAIYTVLGMTVLLALLTWVFSRKDIRLDAQLKAEHALELLQNDSRPPVLYLRSFTSDSKFAKKKLFSLQTKEQSMARLLSEIGPVIGIGKPTEVLPELGAKRFYVTHDAWKEAVEKLLPTCAAIFLIANQTEGVIWETRKSLGAATLCPVVLDCAELWKNPIQSCEVLGEPVTSFPKDKRYILLRPNRSPQGFDELMAAIQEMAKNPGRSDA